ncbi:MAG: hypothetical protein QOG23_1519 [Blastocatellia bacterium]|nr:hypothetical protein [Blastocatellia bacterium]
MQLTTVTTSTPTIREHTLMTSRTEGPDIAAERAYSELTASTCGQCHAPITPSRQRRHAKWCSKKCGDAFRYGAKGNSTLSPSIRNTIARFLVCADLLIRGLKLFVAPAPSDEGDVAIFKNDKLLRVRIKSGRRRTSGNKELTYAKSVNEKCDALAIVIGN